MMRNAVISARVDDATAGRIELISEYTGRSKSWLAAQALHRYAQEEAQFIAFVEDGHAAIERGEVVSETEANRRIDAMIAARRAKA